MRVVCNPGENDRGWMEIKVWTVRKEIEKKCRCEGAKCGE